MTEEPPRDATPMRQERFGPRTSSLAIWCFVFGLLSFFLPVVFSVRAIVMGQFAAEEMERQEDPRSGHNLAFFGRLFGWITLVCGTWFGGGLLLQWEGDRIKSSGRLSNALSQSHAIVTGLKAYDAKYGQSPGLSWRVHVLPFLGHADLYAEFHLNEPWNSPHNQRLIPKMPKCYQRFDSDLQQQSGMTCFQLVVGKGSLFDPVNGPAAPTMSPFGKGAPLLVITDDAHAVTWTAPQDYDRSSYPEGIWARPSGQTIIANSDTRIYTWNLRSNKSLPPNELPEWEE